MDASEDELKQKIMLHLHHSLDPALRFTSRADSPEIKNISKQTLTVAKGYPGIFEGVPHVSLTSRLFDLSDIIAKHGANDARKTLDLLKRNMKFHDRYEPDLYAIHECGEHLPFIVELDKALRAVGKNVLFPVPKKYRKFLP